MGHLIGGGFLKATSKDEAMREALTDAEEFAYYNGDRLEGSDRYSNSFKYYDKVFNTEDEAEEFFASLGSYMDGVCMVKEPSKSAQTKFNKTRDRVNKKLADLREKALENFKNRSSNTVGCKKCGTRISSEVALSSGLHCPNCGKWLVPDSIQERWDKLQESFVQAEKQLRKDTADTGKPRYWAKYEIHC